MTKSDKLSLKTFNEKFKNLYFGSRLLGVIEVVGDGYLAQGNRKAVFSLRDAAKQILDKKMNKCLSEHERQRKLLARISLEND